MRTVYFFLVIILLSFSCKKDIEKKPTIETWEPHDVWEFSAVLYGKVVDNGNEAYRNRVGFCWSTHFSPTINDKHFEFLTDLDLSYQSVFTHKLDSLEPNTTYYAKAYVVKDGKTIYGNDFSFKTFSYSMTFQVNLDAVNATNMNLWVKNTTIITPSEVGICWGISSMPTVNNSKKSFIYNSNSNSYIDTIGPLNLNTTYFLRAYRIDKYGVFYSDEISAKTLNVATLSDLTVDSVSVHYAAVKGALIDNGGYPDTKVGICLATTPNPTIEDKIETKLSDNNFRNFYSGLNASTTYYLRSYATNGAGTIYSKQSTFTTQSIPASYETGNITDARDGHSYKTIKIGDQWWMAENLAYDSPYSYYCNNDNTTQYTYGKLYKASSNVCPSGWYIPTDNDWQKLELYLGMNDDELNKEGDRGTDQATQLGSNGFNITYSGAADSSSYNFPNRIRYFGFGVSGAYWSSSYEIDKRGYGYYTRIFSEGKSTIYRYIAWPSYGTDVKMFKSIRCIKGK